MEIHFSSSWRDFFVFLELTRYKLCFTKYPVQLQFFTLIYIISSFVTLLSTYGCDINPLFPVIIYLHDIETNRQI